MKIKIYYFIFSFFLFINYCTCADLDKRTSELTETLRKAREQLTKQNTFVIILNKDTLTIKKITPCEGAFKDKIEIIESRKLNDTEIKKFKSMTPETLCVNHFLQENNKEQSGINYLKTVQKKRKDDPLSEKDAEGKLPTKETILSVEYSTTKPLPKHESDAIEVARTITQLNTQNEETATTTTTNIELTKDQIKKLSETSQEAIIKLIEDSLAPKKVSLFEKIKNQLMTWSKNYPKTKYTIGAIAFATAAIGTGYGWRNMQRGPGFKNTLKSFASQSVLAHRELVGKKQKICRVSYLKD